MCSSDELLGRGRIGAFMPAESANCPAVKHRAFNPTELSANRFASLRAELAVLDTPIVRDPFLAEHPFHQRRHDER